MDFPFPIVFAVKLSVAINSAFFLLWNLDLQYLFRCEFTLSIAVDFRFPIVFGVELSFEIVFAVELSLSIVSAVKLLSSIFVFAGELSFAIGLL